MKTARRIPKIIHYCWLSNDPFPNDIAAFMKSWKNILPDYELMLWDLKRDQIGENLWVKQAFEAKKYPFAADYIRIYALYHYGGIYLDTDVEVIKNFDDLLHLPYFAGTEGGNWIEAAVLGAEKSSEWLKDILGYFDQPFMKNDGDLEMVAMPHTMKNRIELKRKIVIADRKEIFDDIDRNYQSHFYLFEEDFFSPKNMGTGIINNTANTYTIHHFAMSWIPFERKIIPNIKRLLMKMIGVDNINMLLLFFRIIKK